MPPLSPGRLAQIACLLEATARKPGNVHRAADFDDAPFVDFLLSATAIVEPLDRAAEVGIGASVLGAIESTRRVVAHNTNLGMVLLLAPLAASVGDDLQAGVGRVLASTTVDDARLVYQAIRLAQPGGLGQSAEQDVADEPTVTLREAMALAAPRDLIARQYAHDFEDIFDLAVPAFQAGGGLERSILAAFLAILARHPDTLIARKLGPAIAAEASRRAAEALDAGMTPEALASLDDWLRADGHRRNPGAAADLTAAALFVALRTGTIQLPRLQPW